MTEIDKKDQELVNQIVEKLLAKQKEAEQAKVKESNVELPQEDSKKEKKHKVMDVYGLSSKMNINDLDFNAPRESEDWKLLTCDLLKACYHKDYAWLSAYKQKLSPMVEGTAELGGNLVPTEFYNEVQRRAREEEIIYPRARVIRMTRNAIDIPSEAGTGPKFSYTAEAALKSTTSNEWGKTTLTAYKAAAIKVGSDELFADAAIDLMPYIIDEFGAALARFRDKEFIVGSGSSAIAGIDSYTFTQVNAANGLSGDHMISAYYRLKPYYRSRAVWLMNTRTLADVRALKDTTNQYLLRPLAEGGDPLVLGRPVLTNDDMASSKIFLIDLSTYIIGERQGMTVDVSNEATLESSGYSLWQRDLTGVRVVVRYGGCMVQTEGCIEITNTGVA